jgi:hypothetical protein
MDKESKKALNDKYGVPDDLESFASEMADKEDNPMIKDTKKKSLHELAKEFPDKSYRELEKYRDSDRQEEANEVPLTEAQRNLVEHVEAGACIMDRNEEADRIPLTESQKSQEELEPIETGVCVTGALRKDRQEINWKSRVKELDIALANALAINESHQKLNGKLQERVTELEEESERFHKEIEDKLHRTRKAGL